MATPAPPPRRRSTTWDLEMEERAQYIADPSRQGDSSLWGQLQALGHVASSQVVETACEWLSEVRRESILPLS
eukprot:CAMPEP_0118822830 /NCGR_PEP_ID=MMETSP1162-20130426/9458_1 /TAXON_ID=33656 /ORGANISM="Phaeocystis Sp, Strain CCMP2710" /LENGTH=72 /DNA_ID=CAMNT_0006753407 /DNA_START=58 /DNA_END=276 /DNA_ORIENTATION=-